MDWVIPLHHSTFLLWYERNINLNDLRGGAIPYSCFVWTYPIYSLVNLASLVSRIYLMESVPYLEDSLLVIYVSSLSITSPMTFMLRGLVLDWVCRIYIVCPVSVCPPSWVIFVTSYGFNPIITFIINIIFTMAPLAARFQVSLSARVQSSDVILNT